MACGKMESAKRQLPSFCRRKYRRDSGIYTDSILSEAEVPLRCHEPSFSDNKNNSEYKRFSASENRMKVEVSQKNEHALLESGKEQPQNDTNVLSTNGQDSRAQEQKDAMQTCNHEISNNQHMLESPMSYERQDDGSESSFLTTSHMYQSLNSLRSLPKEMTRYRKKSTLNEADVEVIKRCDDLINQLQDSTRKYHKLTDSYRKNRRLFYILAVVNLILIACVLICVPVLMFTPRKLDTSMLAGSPTENPAVKDLATQYKICYNCSEIGYDPKFSLETVVEVTMENGKCCFRSILSVMKSQTSNFQTALEDGTKSIQRQITDIDKRLLQIEIGTAPDPKAIIGNILQTLAPREKTALYLKSQRETPFRKDYDSFNKLRWSQDGYSAILRGGVELTANGLNIKVRSEAYYFIFTKIQFRHKERARNKQNWPLSYLIYRKRGSIPTYVHEARLNCVFNDMTQEHSSSSEVAIHLNRGDEIFVSVDDSDKDFLSSDFGAHMLGLFEI